MSCEVCQLRALVPIDCERKDRCNGAESTDTYSVNRNYYSTPPNESELREKTLASEVVACCAVQCQYIANEYDEGLNRDVDCGNIRKIVRAE